jgi:hypothetical protein
MLKGMSMKGPGQPAVEGRLTNPDIPGRGLDKASKDVVRDKFFSSMRLGSQARNSEGWSLARSGGLPNMNPKRQEFMLEGAIDPANIRARHNPLKARPNSYAQGAEGFKYQLPDSTGESRDAVSLVRKARESYANRVNRFQPQAVPVREQAPGARAFPST